MSLVGILSHDLEVIRPKTLPLGQPLLDKYDNHVATYYLSLFRKSKIFIFYQIQVKFSYSTKSTKLFMSHEPLPPPPIDPHEV